MKFSDLHLYLIAGFLAFIPALIWLSIIFGKTKRKGIQAVLFFGSVFSVVPVFLLQYFLNVFPQFDVARFFGAHIADQNLNYLILFICVGIVEEIVKQSLIRLVDRKFILIKTINDSIRFSLIGAMGFSFAENIFYIYNIYTQLGIQQLFIAYLFRSIFTSAAHMIFSGYFGYYYGIGKFSLNVVEQSQWAGKRMFLVRYLSRVFETSRMQIYKELKILKGLFIAIVLHAAFNFLLQFNQILPVVIFLGIMGGFLMHLLKRKSGTLIMISDPTKERASSMNKKDEDVVIELLGMWFKSKKYVDVIHICQRLLDKDPDNKVVQMFKAQALDKVSQEDSYGKILKNMFPGVQVKQTQISEMVEKKKTQDSSSPTPQNPPNNQNITSVPPVFKEPPKEEEKYFDLKI